MYLLAVSYFSQLAQRKVVSVSHVYTRILFKVVHRYDTLIMYKSCIIYTIRSMPTEFPCIFTFWSSLVLSGSFLVTRNPFIPLEFSHKQLNTRLGSLKIARPRFSKFYGKYIENIKIGNVTRNVRLAAVEKPVQHFGHASVSVFIYSIKNQFNNDLNLHSMSKLSGLALLLACSINSHSGVNRFSFMKKTSNIKIHFQKFSKFHH